jgi:hypothetical protein
MQTIRILHNLARTGGTIISRCLACMDGVALLSEVHPTLGGEWNSPRVQAREWYGVDVPDGLPFADTIAAIEEAFRSRGQALVLRSWDHVDFVPSSHCQTPAMRSTIVDALEGRFDLLRVKLEREDHLAHLASLERFGEPCGALAFGRGLVAFASMPIPGTTYERFLSFPRFTMDWLCSALSLPRYRAWESKWQRYTHVTGDIANQLDRTVIG